MQDNQLERYSRHILLPEIEYEWTRKITSKSLLNYWGRRIRVIQFYLFSIIWRWKITICDFDNVELSNLQRQIIHNEKSIGMNKAASARNS